MALKFFLHCNIAYARGLFCHGNEKVDFDEVTLNEWEPNGKIKPKSSLVQRPLSFDIHKSMTCRIFSENLDLHDRFQQLLTVEFICENFH